VINVSWDDAKEYVAWLAKKTGKPYRFLTESEWEYAARGLTTTKYAFEAMITHRQAQFQASKTAEVGSFEPNAFGLHDMRGNVWEWVEDCWNDSYQGAPASGSAWMSGDCSRRVLRGGSWFDSPDFLRSANRVGSSSDFRGYNYGFRVVRTITP
jgi:formylglycine-generating enzyme required for sulfatase activity